MSAANNRYKEIHEVHDAMLALMNRIQVENKLAAKLKQDLEHEKVVLEERKAVSTQANLSGETTAVRDHLS